MLPIPKLELQKKIVSEIDALRNKVDQIDTLYQTKLQDISDLRQSLLQKAFTGELIWETQSLHTAQQRI